MVQRHKPLENVTPYETSEFFKMTQRDKSLNEVAIYNTTYICEFFRMIERDHYPLKLKVDIINYVSDFFKMIEKLRDSKEPKTAVECVTMDYVWLKIYDTLRKTSNDKALELFMLSQLKIKNTKKYLLVSLVGTTKTAGGKKRILYGSFYKNGRRFRNSKFH